MRCFMPEGCPKIEAISITLEELETVRLVDLLDLDQEEAAFYMGISRKAFWNDLMNARKKIAAALVYGMGLRIEGGSFALRGGEGSTDMEDQAQQRDGTHGKGAGTSQIATGAPWRQACWFKGIG